MKSSNHEAPSWKFSHPFDVERFYADCIACEIPLYPVVEWVVKGE